MSASLEASLRLEIAQYQASLAKAKGDAQKFKDAIKKTGNGLGGDLFGKLQGQFGGLLPAMGISAVVGGFKHITNSMDDLADTALRLNESTEVIQRVGYASEILAGVNAEGLTTSFLKLEKALGDIENSAAIEALLDVHRANAKRHLTFGHGPHFCAGAEMARVEGRVAFETLLTRLDNIRLAPGAELEMLPSFSARGYQAIPIEFDPAT